MIERLKNEISSLEYRHRPAACYSCASEKNLLVFMDNKVLCRECRILVLEETRKELEDERERIRREGEVPLRLRKTRALSEGRIIGHV